MFKKFPSLIALFQIVGGVLMMVDCGQEMLAQPLHIVQIVLYLLFLLYGGLMCFYGYRLWRRATPCNLPSAWLWFAQAPFIHSGFFSFQLTTGLSVSAVIEFRTDGLSFGIDSLLAQRHILFVGGTPIPYIYVGINLFALFCACTLLKYREHMR
jgi:hypothetical protein